MTGPGSPIPPEPLQILDGGVTGSAIGCSVIRITGVMVKTVGVEFFCYHRDRPGSVTLREELLEQHWSYMDRYATEMIARRPTLAGDGDMPTGSVHIVGLPDPAAARVRLRRATRRTFPGSPPRVCASDDNIPRGTRT